ncbi:hypothetical protein EV130_102443 [Rhizobium azibense]|uniref:Uncharacterized protein n=1 Tax=Rhizobium azibense TaxID=1136135 RepID=A0A4R3R2N1_9HYPH|nr:hypothetical protein EV130_102443 [Rhizobium azibense]
MNFGRKATSVVTGLLVPSIFSAGLSSAAIAPEVPLRQWDREFDICNCRYLQLHRNGARLLAAWMPRIGDRRRLVIGQAAPGSLAYGLVYLFPYKPVFHSA